MPTIPRKTQKIFAGGVSPTNNVAQFGSLKAGAPTYSNDPDVIQALAAFTNGWAGAVVGTNSPAIQDVNALWLLVTQQLAYILQRGVPEYDAATEYSLNCFCSSGAQMYRSVQNGNTGRSVSDTNWWVPFPTAPTAATGIVPTGGMVPCATATAPTGWLLCDGTVYNIATYPALGAALGSTFGGNGTTTFAVPDARGRTLVGAGLGNAVDATLWTLGQKRGAETHSLTSAQNGPHTHALNLEKASDGGDYNASGSNPNRINFGAVLTSGSSGSGTPHNNIQPSLCVNYIIKT